MGMTDPIADMLTRIRNANRMHYETVEIPASNAKLEILKVMLNEGFITDIQESVDPKGFKNFYRNFKICWQKRTSN